MTTLWAFIAYGLVGWGVFIILFVWCAARSDRHPYRDDWPSSEVNDDSTV